LSLASDDWAYMYTAYIKQSKAILHAIKLALRPTGNLRALLITRQLGTGQFSSVQFGVVNMA